MSNSSTQIWAASGLAAGTYPLKNTGAGGVFAGPNRSVMGGVYALVTAGTGLGTVQLNDLAAYNTTYVPTDAIAANGLNRSMPVRRILPWHLAKTYSRYGLRALTAENLVPSPPPGCHTTRGHMISNIMTRPTSLPKTGQAILQIPLGLASDRWGRTSVPPRRQMT
jgi:hypothetical protein